MKTVSLTTAIARELPPQQRQRVARAARGRHALAGIFALVREWRRRARSRAELARLDERLLRDIGLTRAEAVHEIDKPFWRK